MMLTIELWKPCLNCPWLAEVVETDDMTYWHGGKVFEKKTITCKHAPVCARIDGAIPLIRGDAL